MRGGFAQAQAVEHARQRPGGEHQRRQHGGHQAHRAPAHEAGHAQGEALHGLQDVGLGQLHQVAHRAQYVAHHHAGQQQAQRLLHALRQHQRQQHATQRADEGGAGQTQAGQPGRGHLRQRCAVGAASSHDRESQRQRQRRARGAAQQKRIGQRVAEQPLRHRPGQPQQRAGQPGTQRARQADVPHDLPRHRVVARTQHAVETRAAHTGAQRQAENRQRQQRERQPCGARHAGARRRRRQRGVGHECWAFARLAIGHGIGRWAFAVKRVQL